MIQKYVKKQVEVEAILWDGNNLLEVKNFVGDKLIVNGIIDTAYEVGEGLPHAFISIITLEGELKCSKGDYIIKGIKGEFYPCKPDIFEQSYDNVNI